MKNLTWQNPEQLFVAQELINKVKSKCCGIKVIYSSYWLRTFYSSLSRVHSIYLHWRGAFGVARFDKLGDARASTRGTSDRTGSALFRMHSSHLLIMSIW